MWQLPRLYSRLGSGPMASDTDIELAQFIAQFYDDPLGFVIAAYPWDTDESIQLVRRAVGE